MAYLMSLLKMLTARNWDSNSFGSTHKLKTGQITDKFNVCFVTLIQKKSTLNEQSDTRPISVSSVFANLFEPLILTKSNFQNLIHKNQHGYIINAHAKMPFLSSMRRSVIRFKENLLSL